MNDTVIIPSPDALPLPAPAPLLHGLLLLTFLLHLLFMNGLVGGAMIALWARIRSPRGDGPHGELAARIGRLLPTLVAGTVTFGVAPLLFLQALHGRYLFTSSILMGWFWLAVIPLLLLAYYGAYLQAFRGPLLGGWRRPLLAVITLLLLVVGLIYTSNATLMLRPHTWAAMYFANPTGFHGNLTDPQVIPRWLHMMLGALAVAGLLLGLWGRWLRARASDGGGAPDLAMVMRELGLSLLAYTTMANFLVGMLFLITLERPVMLEFMGGSPHATGLLGLGLVLALALIALAMRAKSRPTTGLVPVSVVTVVTLVVMVLMRDFVRTSYLARHGEAFVPRAATQTGNLVVFFVLLVVAFVMVGWMVRKLARSRRSG